MALNRDTENLGVGPDDATAIPSDHGDQPALGP